MQLDALILPINALTSSYAAAGGYINLPCHKPRALLIGAAMSRYPVAVLPLGAQANGEPFGFCLLGRRWSEPTLLSLM
jgi:Asp-tRNA(Asn)/Glu-tRNA(Gln) amidotransferase A subunit family amidase